MPNMPNVENDDPEQGEGGDSPLCCSSSRPTESLVQEDLRPRLTEVPGKVHRQRSQAASLEQRTAENLKISLDALQAAAEAADANDFTAFDESLLDEGLTFMHSKFRADVKRWGRLSSWTVEEAVALFLDRNPNCFQWDKVAHYAIDSALIQRAADLRRLAQDAVTRGELQERTPPHALITWAAVWGYTFPERLTKVVSIHEPNQAPRKAAHDLWQNLSTKQQNNFFRLLLALAVNGYGFNPYKSGSRGPTAMQASMKAVGFDIDPQTITKMLQGIKEEVDEADVEACLIERAKRVKTRPARS